MLLRKPPAFSQGRDFLASAYGAGGRAVEIFGGLCYTWIVHRRGIFGTCYIYVSGPLLFIMGGMPA